LSVAYIDPEKKPLVAKAAGIRKMGTIIVDSGLKKEEAKSLSEEEVTGALIRALKTGERNVCFVTGSGEHGLEDSGRSGYQAVKEALEKNNHKTRTISLLEKAEVPADCTVLLIGGPKLDYVDPAVAAVKKYVEDAGGRALILVDPPLKIGRDAPAPNVALLKLVESWGVTVNADLALDTSGIGQLFGFNEVVPLVGSYESHAIVRDMKETATAFPLTRTLDTKSVDKVTVDKLFSTSANSYATTNLASADIKLDPAKDKKGPLALAAAGTYKGAKEGRFVVVGSSEWISNSIFRVRSVGNMDLFLNIMNWLTSDEDLISIRPKDPEDRRLSLTRAQMMTVRMASIFGFPLAAIGWGLVVWWKRR
ncbi:MAG: GldG family protein, partial [Bryobacteraceae bacterium]